MENKCAIMGLREDEIELELGLSIGGSFGKVEKLKPVKNESKRDDIPVADRGESLVFDPQMKRKIQSLRRQEAKKKREEKQQKRCHHNGEFRSEENDDDDVTEQRECKKNKVEEYSGDVNLNLNAELNNPLAYPVFPVRVPYPYPHLQFVPVANGFPYSWGGGASKVAMNGGLQTGHVDNANGYDSEQNNGKDERNRKTGSNGSSTYSSSIASDLQSSSNPGTTSHQMDSAESIDKCSNDGIEKAPRMNLKKAPPKPETKTTSSTKDADKGEIGKLPNPQTPPIHDILRNMPRVSTTGNGPHGKTINGFLYRYSKSEVSIICVCHGSSFTPAEFVLHAGGNDVSHPLRHITVIPSAIQQM
ncbi:ninja-family protein AFP3-like [Hibiscus syriacus]|uniref:ninja-family protein AFP3-like n=1 Tax=Hibiscus syriacus TaxID=106335 RepID=UPI001924F05B|nr:ninja-family protein AFP3-like [Hibiscus syriacus]